MSRRGGRPFGRDELLGADGATSDPADMAAAMATAGELERVARGAGHAAKPGLRGSREPRHRE